MTATEEIARRLYTIWCRPGKPDWATWDADGDLNPAGLKPAQFRESAEKVRLGVARVLCMDNYQPECAECTFDTCGGSGYFEWADRVLGIPDGRANKRST